MEQFVETEIIARESRIDPELDAARAGYRLIAIGQALALSGTGRCSGLSALDLLLEGAAVCSVAAATQHFAAIDYASDRYPHRRRATDNLGVTERPLAAGDLPLGSAAADPVAEAIQSEAA